MVMKRAFSMVELIITIVVMGILAGGAYISMAQLYSKSARSKAISQLSIDSTRISNQITSLLKDRIPASVIGYDSESGNFESIYNITTSYEILEWISTDFDLYKDGNYSGFIDFDASDPTQKRLHSPGTTISDYSGEVLIFSGAFDEGDISYSGVDFNNSFGWHGNTHDKIYEINTTSSGADINLTVKPDTIYEKYSLSKQAYAIARYEDINASATCISDLDLGNNINDNTLFLFFGYKPWSGETFCADPHTGGNPNGEVTILSNESSGFEVDFYDENLQFNLSLTRIIKKPGKDLNVTISKQKVVY
jgi:prepilin-type N-terminal cleavage/methylation domain-containing protein